MAENTNAAAVAAPKKKKQTQGAVTWARLKKDKMAMIGLVVFGLLVIMAIAAPLLMTHDYSAQDLYNMFAKPSKEHWFGADNMGRDIYSRILYGAKYSLSIGVISIGCSSVIGVCLGALCGYYGGKFDLFFMRFLDIFASIPPTLLNIAIVASLGAGLRSCIIALTVGRITGFARMTRAQMMNVKGFEYVEAATAINASEGRIIFKHMLPNALSPVLVSATMGMASAVLAAAGLSFIGLGVQPPLPEWGAMLSEGRNYIRDYPHLVVFPGIFIMISVLSLNMFGDGLRDAMDPRLKR